MAGTNEKAIEAKKVLKEFGIIALIFLVVMLGVGVLFYNGFFYKVPSSATYLTNFNNLDSVKSWDSFKTTYPQIDPKTLEASQSLYTNTNPNPLSVTITEPNWLESATTPKTCIYFNVAIKTNFWVNDYYNPHSKGSLTQPSLLIFLLDQNDRIRGKLYTIQGSSDFVMNADNESDATFYFNVPKDMENQPISIIVELFGVQTSTTDYNYYNSYDNQIRHSGYIDISDPVYGSIPAKTSQYLQDGYQNINFLVFSRIPSQTPATYSVIELAGYSETLSVAVSALLAFGYLVRNRTYEWRTKHRFHIAVVLMFIVTYFLMLILIGVLK